MGNFEFLKKEKNFEAFADTAIAAERVFHIDLSSSAINCRRAAEFAVKWMYSVDRDLVMPYQDNFVTLINTDEFRGIVGKDILKCLDFIRKVGNSAAHQPKNVTKDTVALSLKYLHTFLKFVAYSYSLIEFDDLEYDLSLIENITEKTIPVISEVDFAKLKQENENLKLQLTTIRSQKAHEYQPHVNFTEEATRKAYIDVMLTDAGWTRGQDWEDEFFIENMPNKSGYGAADYVLFDDAHIPLAVIEAKKTSKDVAVGRTQAKLYADDIERRFGRRPIIFLTNGFDTRIIADQPNGYPERRISFIYSKKDLQKEFFKIENKVPLVNAVIDDKISERYYQKEAIKAVCESFGNGNRRKALLVMATGSGKTRTVISLVDVLQRHNWIENFLFLADRNSLVTQAKRAFVNCLPNVSVTNLVEDKDNPKARGVFSTYQTMMGCIDSSKDEHGEKLYTSGHFDLIIVDEAHRSLYKKYKAIFEYFDALLIGLTATPRDDIDKNTYEVFDLESGVPTYNYELSKAVEDKFLVDYNVVDCKLKFLQAGIKYNDLPEEEKDEYEKTFVDEDGELIDNISSEALNSWVFNEDTIKKVLNTLLMMGLRVNYGNDIGKTIIFAKSHRHAEKIMEIWNKEFPSYPDGYCTVIDNYTNYAQSVIDSFSDKKKLPQIAISVDMLDTGIDVPEILNLVFFKSVFSKAKFWQMIGRGTRLCKNLLDTGDKERFFIFDFCGIFDFFDVNPKGVEGTEALTLQEVLFNLRAEIAYKLQNLIYQTDELVKMRAALVKTLVDKVCELNRDNFTVKLALKYVDYYSVKDNYTALTYEQVLELKENIAPLLLPEKDEFNACRFDALMYQIELATLTGQKAKRHKRDLVQKLEALTKLGTIPDVKKQGDFIYQVLKDGYLDKAGMEEWEAIRIRIRDLIKYIPRGKQPIFYTNFTDEILSVAERGPIYQPELENYKKKMEQYVLQHQDIPVIAKLKTNQPLSPQDMLDLEKLMWKDLGTEGQFKNEYGNVPLGEFVRSIIGLDREATVQAFSKFINDDNLNAKQIDFVNMIIGYISKNGMLKDFTVFNKAPFNRYGAITKLFANNLGILKDIQNTIVSINENAH